MKTYSLAAGGKMRNFMGGKCTGGKYRGWEMFGNSARWELSGVGIVRGGKCTGWEKSGWEISEMEIVPMGKTLEPI